MILFDNSAVGGNSYYLPRNKFSAVHQSFFYCVFNAAAAWNFHAYHSYAFYVVTCNDGGEFFGIINRIKLWASDESDLISDKIVVEVSVGVCGAVCGNKKVCVVKIWCVCGHKFYLTRPLPQP